MTVTDQFMIKLEPGTEPDSIESELAIEAKFKASKP